MAIHTGGVRMDVTLPPHIIGPAPKEEVMQNPKRINCKTCGSTAFEEDGVTWCSNCSSRKADIAAERRVLYREAYMAALMGLCFGVAPTVASASALALETVRQWDAMMAELEEG